MRSECLAADKHGRGFPAGSVLFGEGAPGRRMRHFEQGQIRKGRQPGVPTPLLRPGEAFRELAPWDEKPKVDAQTVYAEIGLLTGKTCSCEVGENLPDGEEYPAARSRFESLKDIGRKTT